MNWKFNKGNQIIWNQEVQVSYMSAYPHWLLPVDRLHPVTAVVACLYWWPTHQYHHHVNKHTHPHPKVWKRGTISTHTCISLILSTIGLFNFFCRHFMKKFPIEDRNISKTIKLLPAKIKIIESDDN